MHSLTKKNKKILLATIMATGLALAITQGATAHPGYHGGDQDYQQRQRGVQADLVTQKAREKFLGETTEIRKQMAEKRAAMRAIMQAETPDADRVAVLAGELFDLREQMRLKAQELGLPLSTGMGRQCGLNPGGRGAKGRDRGQMRGQGFYGQRL